uniref:RRM domain-containing protein n=1 Tax=Aegilops tauschii subsp. strangulata TaxID=200361 RepID=A0A453HTZ0_AEGTS
MDKAIRIFMLPLVPVPRAMVRSRSPKGGDDGRRRSTPRRSSDEQGGRKEKGPISLLVRNIPHNCRYEDLRVPFAKFGPVRDIYMPKDYYSGEPKGFAFIEFFDSHDASEAQYHMNHKLFCGREIKVEPATDKRKRPEDMRRRTGVRVHSGSKGHDLSRHGNLFYFHLLYLCVLFIMMLCRILGSLGDLLLLIETVSSPLYLLMLDKL